MQLEVWHLGGGERGHRTALEGPVVRVGSSPDAELRLQGTLPEHAEIAIEGTKVYLRPKGPVRLNGRTVGEVVLEDGDLLDVGEHAHLRLRLRADERKLAGEIAAELARAPAPPSPRPGRLVHGPAGAALTLLILLILLGGAWFATRERPRESLAQSLARERSRQDQLRTHHQKAQAEHLGSLREELSDLQRRMADRAEVDARMGEVKRAVAELESSVLDRVSSEIEAIEKRPALEEALAAVKRLEEIDAAAERIITTYARSVCLIQGSYGFGKVKDGKWHWLREAAPEIVKSLEIDSDQVPLILDGDGPVFQVEYTGTGFLADAKGLVLTNRHIAQPWWKNDAAEPLLKDGYEARFVHLRAYFPGRRKPVTFDLKRTMVSDTTDLAALRFVPDGRLPPALELAEEADITPGRRVLLLGYPSGLDALIARTEEEFARQITHGPGMKPLEVLDALSQRGLVRPLPTQGHISDVLPDKVLFDAPTAVGGSGGPLLDLEGRVVAINYGILKAFSGANFGVPAHHARALLR